MNYKEKAQIIGFIVCLLLALAVPDVTALVIPGRPEYEARDVESEAPSYYREGRFIYSTEPEREREPEGREVRMSYPNTTRQAPRRGALLDRSRQTLQAERSTSDLPPTRPASRTIRYHNPTRTSSARRGPSALRIPGRDYSTASRPASAYAVASWYGWDFHGRKTANGETYNMYKRTAAHKTLPFGTVVRVTNLSNGRQTVVRINDRGPFVEGRDIDLSYATARELGMLDSGVAQVRLEILSG